MRKEEEGGGRTRPCGVDPRRGRSRGCALDALPLACRMRSSPRPYHNHSSMLGFPIVHPSRAPRGDGLLHHHPVHRRIPLIDYAAVCMCLIVCPLVIFKDPSRHLRSWRSRALSARAHTAGQNKNFNSI
eukprot:scaffold18992_cov113-Isochrysis_galbana.AAC.7